MFFDPKDSSLAEGPDVTDFDDVVYTKLDGGMEEVSLDGRDLAIILCRALSESRLLSAVDLANCSDGDLLDLRDMIQDQIDMRLQSHYCSGSGYMAGYGYSEVLLRQFDADNIELCQNQAYLLADILGQVGTELMSRGVVYEVVDLVRGRFDDTAPLD